MQRCSLNQCRIGEPIICLFGFLKVNQRLTCGCIESVDIGTYDSCMHGCVYWYADSGRSMASLNMARHNPASPILIGEIEDAVIITERDAKQIICLKTLM